MSKKQAQGIALICGNTIMAYGVIFSLVYILEKVFPCEWIKIFVDDPKDQVDGKSAEEKRDEWKKEQEKNLKKQWFCYFGLAIPVAIAFIIVNKKIEEKYNLPLFKIVKNK